SGGSRERDEGGKAGRGAAPGAPPAEKPVAPDEKLRPQRLHEIVGQRRVAERLAISLEAAPKRGEPLPHILFDGPPGLGQTTFATGLHNELGVELDNNRRAPPAQKNDRMAQPS